MEQDPTIRDRPAKPLSGLAWALVLVMVGVSVLVPPWEETYQKPGMARASKPIGYRLLISPPRAPDTAYHGVRIDFGRLALQWLALAAFGGAIHVLRRRNVMLGGDVPIDSEQTQLEAPTEPKGPQASPLTPPLDASTKSGEAPAEPASNAGEHVALRLRRQQTVVLGAGALAVTILCLFPPWEETWTERQRVDSSSPGESVHDVFDEVWEEEFPSMDPAVHVERSRDLGHALIQPLREAVAEATGLSPFLGRGPDRRVGGTLRVDLNRLSILICATLGLTAIAGAVAEFRTQRRERSP